MFKYIKDQDRRSDEYLGREFGSQTSLEALLDSIDTWVGHTRRHLAAGHARQAQSSFWQIHQTVDVVHTRLTDMATVERAAAEAEYTESSCYVKCVTVSEDAAANAAPGWIVARIFDEQGRLHRVRVRWDKTGRTSEVSQGYVQAVLPEWAAEETLHAARLEGVTNGLLDECLNYITVRYIARDGATMWDDFSEGHQQFCRFIYKDLTVRGLIDSVPLAYEAAS